MSRSCPAGQSWKILRRLRIILLGLSGDSRDPGFGASDLLLAVEDAEHRFIGPAFAMLQPDHLTALAGSEIAEHMVGRWLYAKCILPGLEILPLIGARQLVLAR